jgi:hypothetical protein
VERVGVDYYGGVSFFTNNWKSSAILIFYKPAEPEAPLFDVYSGVCDTPPQEEESALVCALAYFKGVLDWRIADTSACCSVTLCMHGSGFVTYFIM